MTWVKGQSGNPAGRPRKHRAVIDVIGPEGREELLHALFERAKAGDTAAAKLLLDRTDATLSRQELTGAEGKPIALEQAERTAQALPTEVLKQLDSIAEKLEADQIHQVDWRGEDAARPDRSSTH